MPKNKQMIFPGRTGSISRPGQTIAGINQSEASVANLFSIGERKSCHRPGLYFPRSTRIQCLPLPSYLSFDSEGNQEKGKVERSWERFTRACESRSETALFGNLTDFDKTRKTQSEYPDLSEVKK